MRYLGYFGLVLGSLIGLLVVIVVAILLRSVPPPVSVQPPPISPDITIFLSEQSLSRIASDILERPTVIDFDLNGQMQVTTRAKVGWVEPIIHMGLLLEMQGTDVVSEFDWLRLGFLTIPARWLPQSFDESSAMVGQIIKNQTPPDFILTGLTTTADGITFQLKWIGQ